MKKDITAMVGSSPADELSPYLAGLSVSGSEQSHEDDGNPIMGADSNHLPKPDQKPAAPLAKGRKERGTAKHYTTVRLSDEAYASISRAAQCYRIATGNNISLGDFVALSVKRALPHLSKQAYQVMSTLQKDTPSPFIDQ